MSDRILEGPMVAITLEDVRKGCRQVAEESVNVRIRASEIPEYAESIPIDRLTIPYMDPAVHYLGHGTATVTFFLCLDTINFGSGYFPFIFKDARISGFRAIAAALTEHFRRYGPPSPDLLCGLTREDCAVIFNLDVLDPPVSELMDLFASSLKEMGQFVEDRFDGDFMGVIEEARGSVERLVGILGCMRSYQDVGVYNGYPVPFYKRAQLLAADLVIAFSGHGPGRFDDIDRITICADNLVPHVLMLDGILAYSDLLRERIEMGDEVVALSPEEVELRACAVHAGELVLQELKKRVPTVNGMLLDNYLWHQGQQAFYRKHRRHLTKTIFY